MKAHGRFTWFELVTPDTDAGLAFWSEVAGFGTSSMDMGDRSYALLVQGEKPIAGVVVPQMPDVAPHWLSYWEFDEIDTRAAAVVANGGTLIVPPTDIPVGRFAIAADPQGAVFALFRGNGGDEPGNAFEWNELWTTDAEAAIGFYARVLGLDRDVMDMPQGPYHVLKVGDAAVAGVITSHQPEAPPMWLPYLRADDVDDAIGRVRTHGGRVIADLMDVAGVGRFGIVADRQGAVLGLIRPAPRA